jgi:rhodanese-related sulfurtransferase
LIKAGFVNVYPLEGGLKAWLDAGNPSHAKPQ